MRFHLLAVALCAVCALTIGPAAFAGECDPAENAFCDCTSDSDCTDNDPLMAGLCRSGSCSNKFAPWAPWVSNVYGFCNAYVNGCRETSITVSKDGSSVEVRLTGPGRVKESECSLEVTIGGTSVESRSAERLADSVEACVHNAPVYFYETVKNAQEGTAYCCGYDWSYRPARRAGR